MPRPVCLASFSAVAQRPSWSSTSPLITIVIVVGAAAECVVVGGLVVGPVGGVEGVEGPPVCGGLALVGPSAALLPLQAADVRIASIANPASAVTRGCRLIFSPGLRGRTRPG